MLSCNTQQKSYKPHFPLLLVFRGPCSSYFKVALVVTLLVHIFVPDHMYMPKCHLIYVVMYEYVIIELQVYHEEN